MADTPKPIDESYWRAYLEAYGLSVEEVEAEVRADMQKEAEAAARIETSFAALAALDPGRAAELRAHYEEAERARADRCRELQMRSIARGPGDVM